MAKGFVVSLEGEVSSFGLTRVSREKLYGRRVRKVVDENGDDCVAAMLTRDGSALLPPGCTASLYVDDAGDVVSRTELVAIDAEGNELPSIPSTLGEEQALQGPVPPTRVLDHLVNAVYELDPEELGDALRARLEAGDIFETRFAYRTGFDDSAAFLLKSEEGFFALIGDPTGFEMIRAEQVASEEDEEEEDPFDDDLDFGML